MFFNARCIKKFIWNILSLFVKRVAVPFKRYHHYPIILLLQSNLMKRRRINGHVFKVPKFVGVKPPSLCHLERNYSALGYLERNQSNKTSQVTFIHSNPSTL